MNQRHSRSKNIQLPPLVLHPFDSPAEAELSDWFVGSETECAQLQARYAELRMLCFLGRDLGRWVAQCVEVADPTTKTTASSFISLLLFHAPANVTTKLSDWGISHYQTMFSRALGLNVVFPLPPAPDALSDSLLRNFHVYADSLFDLRLAMTPGADLQGESCSFEVFASGELTEVLERGLSEAEA